MTHRDGFPRLSARSAWRGDAGHRKPCGTPSAPRPKALGKPPFRSRRRTAGGRRKALPKSRIARGFPPTRPMARRIACAIYMGHYQRSLVLYQQGIPAGHPGAAGVLSVRVRSVPDPPRRDAIRDSNSTAKEKLRAPPRPPPVPLATPLRLERPKPRGAP